MKARLLMAGRTRYLLPLEPSIGRKFEALQRRFELRVLARGQGAGGVFRLLSAGAGFWAELPFALAGELRRFRPDAIVAQDPHVTAAALLGRGLARRRVPVVLEVHGDWRTATRLYGSSARRLLSPLADNVAAAAVRRADAVRTVSGYTTGLVRELGVEPAAVFPAFMDLEPFLGPPAALPASPAALFVGVLEHYKGIDELAAAWRLAVPRVPGAVLRIVGQGSRRHVVESLVRELPEQTAWGERLATPEVAVALDRATALVLSSRSEGMGRVVVEALCRGRPVVATRVGGIPDLVRDDENGLLVEPGDPAALADAIVRVLSGRPLAERLAAGARPSVEPWLATPEEYAERLRELVGRVSG